MPWLGIQPEPLVRWDNAVTRSTWIFITSLKFSSSQNFLLWCEDRA